MSVLSFVYGIVGAYMVFLGIKILLTGKLTVAEEKKLEAFTPAAAKTYKRTYAVVNILSGLLFIALTVIKILLRQEIITGDDFVYTIIIIAVVLVLWGIVFLVNRKCKKDSNNG